MIITEQKKELRKVMLAKRGQLDIVEKKQMDLYICQQLINIVDSIQPKVVHCYLPMGSEIDITNVINYLITKNIIVVTPKTLRKRQLENLVLNSLEETEVGLFGTTHPSGDNLYTGNYDLFIIPGLAFDSNKYRLGYGAGYYDGFLSQQKTGLKAAICYPFQIVDEVPIESHDVQLDTILSYNVKI